jgi:hypothetical protein
MKKKRTMELINREWKEFVIDDLFNVKIGKNIDGNKIDKQSGKFVYITRKESNNGCDGFIDSDKKLLNNDFPVITIGNETAEPFVQEFPFFTGTKVNILIPKNFLSSKMLFFIVTSLKAHKSKYSYSFTINSTRLKRQKILLPVNSKNEPDYAFMENYMKQKETDFLEKYEKQLSNFEKVVPLSEKEWKEFKIDNIFSVTTGSLVPKETLKKGKIARLTATDNNNGIFDFYEKAEHKNYREISNFISVSFLGSVFYHPYSASLDMKIHAVQIPTLKLNKYIAEFLVFCFKRMASSFSYGDQLSSTDLPKKKILLHINSEGKPDYAFMENYMKHLEREKLKAYLRYRNKNFL